MNEQFMQILQQVGPEAILIIIETLAGLSEEQLQQLIQELQQLAQQGDGQALQEPSAQQNLFGG